MTCQRDEKLIEMETMTQKRTKEYERRRSRRDGQSWTVADIVIVNK